MKAGARIGSRRKTATIALGLLILNTVLVFPRFTGEYTQYLGSIEAGYISAAKFIVEHFSNLGWNPLWYMGYPFHIFYTPLLPYLMAAISSSIPTISTPAAYRLITSFLYALGPVTLYIFVKELTKRDNTALISALFYSLLPSASYFLGGIRDVASGFGYAPWRLLILVLYGEGPHISGLAFTPLAVLFFLKTWKRPAFGSYLLTAGFISLVALIDLAALYGLALILTVTLFTEMMAGDPRRKMMTAFKGALLTYGLCAFWYNLSFIRVPFAYKAGEIDIPLSALLPSLIILLPLMVAVFSLLAGKEKLQPILLPLTWFLLILVITVAHYRFGLDLSPEPNRYIPEMDMAFAILLGIVVTVGIDHVAKASKRGALLQPLGTVITPALVLLLAIPLIGRTWELTQSRRDMENTSEYRIAQFLAAQEERGRAYATGTNAFWLNIFSQVPQVRGGLDQSNINPWMAHAAHQINTGQDGSLAELWLKALNARYVVVNYPDSSVAYKDYRYPDKFEGLLREIHRHNGDVIFSVPLRHPELVQAIDSRKLEALNPIQNAIDVQNLSTYVALIEEESPQAIVDYSVEDNDHLTIDATLGENAALLVKMTYHAGWKAYSNGNRLPIEPDPLGFMVIKPEMPGEYFVELGHERLWDEWLGYGLTILTLSLIAFETGWQFRSRRGKLAL